MENKQEMTSRDYQFSGTHIVVDLYGVDFPETSKQASLQVMIERACLKGQVEIITSQLEFFTNGGYTLFVLLKESHLAIHTYPERQALFLDVFTCGSSNTQAIVDEVIAFYQPDKVVRQTLHRGLS